MKLCAKLLPFIDLFKSNFSYVRTGVNPPTPFCGHIKRRYQEIYQTSISRNTGTRKNRGTRERKGPQERAPISGYVNGLQMFTTTVPPSCFAFTLYTKMQQFFTACLPSCKTGSQKLAHRMCFLACSPHCTFFYLFDRWAMYLACTLPVET